MQSVEQLCFGTGPADLNLAAVQQRVNDMIRVLDVLVRDLGDRVAHWENLLDKLNIINMSYMQLVSDLRPLLRQYIVYPKYTDSQAIEDNLPVSLGSRLLDDQIMQEQQWRTDLPGGVQQLITQPGAAVQAAEEQVSEFQNLVGWLTNLSHTLKAESLLAVDYSDLLPGVLDPKGAMRQQVDRTSREIKAAAEAAEATRQQAGAVTATAAQTAVVVGQKRGRTAQAAVAEAAAALNVRSEEDILLAKILSGELFAEREKQLQHNR